MSKYIDAEWLIKESMPLSFSVQKWVNEVQIMTAPSIDIVRCKECKWGEVVRNHSIGFCENQCGVRSAITESSYCSYGERREP